MLWIAFYIKNLLVVRNICAYWYSLYCIDYTIFVLMKYRFFFLGTVRLHLAFLQSNRKLIDYKIYIWFDYNSFQIILRHLMKPIKTLRSASLKTSSSTKVLPSMLNLCWRNTLYFHRMHACIYSIDAQLTDISFYQAQAYQAHYSTEASHWSAFSHQIYCILDFFNTQGYKDI